ncbi:hypothetical protein [Nitratireductor aquibiodomus]|nr:hypothetical protein [Nitratireductor aquibiodomus]
MLFLDHARLDATTSRLLGVWQLGQAHALSASAMVVLITLITTKGRGN